MRFDLPSAATQPDQPDRRGDRDRDGRRVPGAARSRVERAAHQPVRRAAGLRRGPGRFRLRTAADSDRRRGGSTGASPPGLASRLAGHRSAAAAHTQRDLRRGDAHVRQRPDRLARRVRRRASHGDRRSSAAPTCHTTMEPEWKAYQVSPHAKVACVPCHVGSGAKALVQSKVAGTRQLWHVITNNIPTPVDHRCTRCGRPAKPARPATGTKRSHGDKLKVDPRIRRRREPAPRR